MLCGKSGGFRGLSVGWPHILNPLPARRYEDARRAYHHCIRLDTLNVCALTSLGLIEHRLGEVRRSIDHYHEVRPSLLVDVCLQLILALVSRPSPWLLRIRSQPSCSSSPSLRKSSLALCPFPACRRLSPIPVWTRSPNRGETASWRGSHHPSAKTRTSLAWLRASWRLRQTMLASSWTGRPLWRPRERMVAAWTYHMMNDHDVHDMRAIKLMIDLRPWQSP